MRERTVNSLLSRTLRAEAAVSGASSYFREMASRVGTEDAPQLSAVPRGMRSKVRFDDDRILGSPFSRRFLPEASKAVRRPPAQPNLSPRPPEQIVTGEALETISNWLQVESQHLNSVFDALAADDERPPRPPGHKCIAIGDEGFFESARGVVWDCREVASTGQCRVADFEADMSSDLNRAALRRELRDWPDQQMVDMILNGVQLQAEVPLQFVLCPHLGSLAEAPHSVESELIRLGRAKDGLRYLQAFGSLPFLPLRLSTEV